MQILHTHGRDKQKYVAVCLGKEDISQLKKAGAIVLRPKVENDPVLVLVYGRTDEDAADWLLENSSRITVDMSQDSQ